jgi:hypothetical protein
MAKKKEPVVVIAIGKSKGKGKKDGTGPRGKAGLCQKSKTK